MVNDINMAYESKHLRPLVSIVTATYNSARFIQETYASIASQTIKDWEWIITDDCSTDSTVHIIKSICMNDSRVSFTVNQKTLEQQLVAIRAFQNVKVSLSPL